MGINRKSTSGGIANPMTASLDGGAYNITNVADIEADGITLDDLTASNIVETSAGKVLVSAAKGTAYNKNIGTTAGTIAAGDDARIVAAKSDGDTLKAADGTVGAPGFAFNDDADNGLYRKGADNWAITCGGANILEFTEAANKREVFLNGKLELLATDVNDATYTVLETDIYLQVRRTSTGTCTITLPAISTVGAMFLIIKDSGYNATANAITIARTGADTIDDTAASYTEMESGESLMLIGNATTSDWEIV
jgi:hypothetical protein